nr:helix-turn-helix transcriptional regulator [Chloroflexota bacterium]
MPAPVTFPGVLDIEKVRELRLKRGLSQAEAAAAAGLAGRQRWYEIESGTKSNITIDTLNRVAAALGVKARDLL